MFSTRFRRGRGSAPDPARGAHDAPPEPLVGHSRAAPWAARSTRTDPQS